MALHAAGVLAVEVEPRPGEAGHESEPRRPGRVHQMGGHIVHGPSSTERLLLPPRGVEVLEVVDQRRTLRVHDRPYISHRHLRRRL
jgi:hypothetical protein